MAFIYKIINNINNKVYIGKTEYSVEKRWKEHCNDAFKDRNEKRPLYAAIRKYGIKNFSIELIEETNIPEEKEIYWIKYYNSFENGYNATLGGDGKHYADYDLIYSFFQKGLNNKEISEITGYDFRTIQASLNRNNVSVEERQKRGHEHAYKKVAMINPKTNQIIQIFPSMAEAVKEIGEANSSHIAAVCQGKRKTCRGFSWKYV